MKRFIYIGFLAILALNVWAQPEDMDTLFAWKAEIANPTVPQGGEILIDLTLTVSPDHLIYRNSVTFETAASGSIESQAAVFPTPQKKPDPLDEGKMKEIYTGTAQFHIPLSIPSDEPLGEKTISVTVGYQGCSKEVCFFPQQTEFSNLSFTVIAGDSTEKTSTPSTPSVTTDGAAAPPANQLQEWMSQGFLLTLLLVYVFGLLTCLTPCVYPLIPITISIFGAREAKTKFEALSLSATYVLGMAVMYSSLGFFAAMTGAVFGQYMSNPWVIGVIAAIFIALGASMLGAFDFQIPSLLQERLGQAGGHGYGSAFVMGTIAGIIAAPCTGPILAGILLYVATEGNPYFGFILLFTYSFGLGTPFLLLGVFSSLLANRPQAGGWMESVKSVFGIIMFVAALYFLKNVIPALREPLYHSIWTYFNAGLLLLGGFALGAIHYSFHTGTREQKFQKATGILLCSIALYLTAASWTDGKTSGWMPTNSRQSTAPDLVKWTYDLDVGLNRARREDRPVLIDFHAEWCEICKEIDADTFHDPNVAKALKRFVCIKVDLTKKTKENQAIQKEYSILGLPVIEFLDSDSQRIPNKRITGYIGPEDFLKHIADIK